MDRTITTELGPIRLAITDGEHVFARVDAHVNDDLPALTYRDHRYIGSVHLYRVEGEWVTKRLGSTEHVSFTRTDVTDWRKSDATPTATKALLAAVIKAVEAEVTEVDLLEAEHQHRVNEALRLQGVARAALEVKRAAERTALEAESAANVAKINLDIARRLDKGEVA